MVPRRAFAVPEGLRIAAGLALLVELGCIAWLATRGGALQSQIQSFFMLGDTAAHALAFIVAGLTGSLAFRSWRLAFAWLCAVAGGVEIIQSFDPARTASALDFAASLSGVALGVASGAALWPATLGRLSRP